MNIKDAGQYVNECCFGGDLVLAEIEKSNILADGTNERIARGQEDWGWYLGFWRGPAKFEISICFETEAKPPEYRVHVIRQIRSGLLSKKMEDNGELELIRDAVKTQIDLWSDSPCQVERIELE